MSTIIDSVTIQNCRASAITVQHSKLQVVNSVFKNNLLANGGAIRVDNSSLLVRNSEFSGNVATTSGGAIHCVDITSSNSPAGLIIQSSRFSIPLIFG